MDGPERHISPADLRAKLDAEAHVPIIDVRSRAEFDIDHIEGAQSFPLDELDSAENAKYLAAVRIGTEKSLYVSSASGARAAEGARRLEARGMTNVHVLEGGNEAWGEAGLPMRNQRRLSLSLPQQLLVLVALFVLLKSALALGVHPAFFVSTAIAGAVLALLGPRHYRDLLALLAQMPWNRPARRAPTLQSAR